MSRSDHNVYSYCICHIVTAHCIFSTVKVLNQCWFKIIVYAVRFFKIFIQFSDPSQLYELTNNSENTTEERSQSGLMTSSYVLIGGIVIAVIVLLASVLIQYTMSSKDNI